MPKLTKYEVPTFEVPSISSIVSQNIPQPDFDNLWDDGESPYELLQKSAHNSEEQKKVMEQQLEPLKEIANSAKKQAESSESIAESAKMQSDIAVAKSKKADVVSWIALLVSIFVAFIEFVVNYDVIIAFIHRFI